MSKRSFGIDPDPMSYAEGRGGPKKFIPPQYNVYRNLPMPSQSGGGSLNIKPPTTGIPSDIQGNVVIDLINQSESKKRPLKGARNASGGWTLENGMVLSNDAFVYLSDIGIVSGGVSSPFVRPRFENPFA